MSEFMFYNSKILGIINTAVIGVLLVLMLLAIAPSVAILKQQTQGLGLDTKVDWVQRLHWVHTETAQARMYSLLLFAGLLLLAAFLASPSLAADARPLQPADVFNLKDVSDPRLSPDGRQVAYTVTTLDAKEDDSDADVYLVSTDGGEPLRRLAVTVQLLDYASVYLGIAGGIDPPPYVCGCVHSS